MLLVRTQEVHECKQARKAFLESSMSVGTILWKIIGPCEGGCELIFSFFFTPMAKKRGVVVVVCLFFA